jgi:hypothetical protein
MRKFIRVNLAEMGEGGPKGSRPALIDAADIKLVEQVGSKDYPAVRVVFSDGSDVHCLGDVDHFKEGLAIAGVI